MRYRAALFVYVLLISLYCSPVAAASDELEQARIYYLLGDFAQAHHLLSALEEDAEAQYLLARMYEHGDGGEVNLDEARLHYHLAWQLGHELAEQRLHQIENNLAGEEVVVIQWHRWQAEEGDVAAQYHLARMFDIGWGVFPNPQAAEEWYRAAVAQGHLTAMFRLGLIYLSGVLGEGRLEEARQLIRHAANEGEAVAKYWQALVIDAPDLSLEEQIHLAAGFRRLVEELDEARAWLPAALLQLRGSPQHVAVVDRVLPGGDLAGLRQRAMSSDAKSMFLLGMRYVQGAGVERDALEGLRWIGAAADQGYTLAADYQQLWFGSLDALGSADSSAFYDFIDQARQGSVQALFEIALLFENGRGVAYNLEQARRWYSIAALLGHKDAAMRLNFLPRAEIPLAKAPQPQARQSFTPSMNIAIAILLLPAALGLLMLWLRRREQRPGQRAP